MRKKVATENAKTESIANIDQNAISQRLKVILKGHVRDYTIGNAPTLAVLFTIDEAITTEIVWKTLAELKPIYDRLGGNLEFDQTDKSTANGTLPMYMSFASFIKLYEKIDAEKLSDDQLLLSMIEFDESNHIGHNVFLRYVYEKRNSEGA